MCRSGEKHLSLASSKPKSAEDRLEIQQSVLPLLIHPWAQVRVQHRHTNSFHLNRTISLLDMKIQAGKYMIPPFLFWQFCESSNKFWTDFYLILSLSHNKFMPALTFKVRIICFPFTSRDIKFHIYHTFIADVPKKTNQVLNVFYSDG